MSQILPDDVALPSPDAVALAAKILSSVRSVVVGHDASLKLVLATLLSGGHALLEDRPGVGKTILARAIATTFGVDNNRVQGTADLLPTDITGVHVFNPSTGAWTFREGPIQTSLLLVDELNRATPKAQSALLEAMAEKQVTVGGERLMLPDPFMVIATQNPQGEVGTHPLGNAQLDRFAAMVRLGLPDREAERQVVNEVAGAKILEALAPAADRAGIVSLISQIRALPVHEDVVEYTLDVVDEIRSVDDEVWLSVRVPQTVVQVARGHAVLSGRDYVAPEDVQAVLPAVVQHRLPWRFDAEVIGGLLASVPVPPGSP